MTSSDVSEQSLQIKCATQMSHSVNIKSFSHLLMTRWEQFCREISLPHKAEKGAVQAAGPQRRKTAMKHTEEVALTGRLSRTDYEERL